VLGLGGRERADQDDVIGEIGDPVLARPAILRSHPLKCASRPRVQTNGAPVALLVKFIDVKRDSATCAMPVHAVKFCSDLMTGEIHRCVQGRAVKNASFGGAFYGRK